MIDAPIYVVRQTEFCPIGGSDFSDIGATFMANFSHRTGKNFQLCYGLFVPGGHGHPSGSHFTDWAEGKRFLDSLGPPFAASRAIFADPGALEIIYLFPHCQKPAVIHLKCDNRKAFLGTLLRYAMADRVTTPQETLSHFLSEYNFSQEEWEAAEAHVDPSLMPDKAFSVKQEFVDAAELGWGLDSQMKSSVDLSFKLPTLQVSEAKEQSKLAQALPESINKALEAAFLMGALSRQSSDLAKGWKEAAFIYLKTNSNISFEAGKALDHDHGKVVLATRSKYLIDNARLVALVKDGEMTIETLVNLAFPNGVVRGIEPLQVALGEKFDSIVTSEMTEYLRLDPAKSVYREAARALDADAVSDLQFALIRALEAGELSQSRVSP